MGEIEKVFNFETFLTGGGITLILGLLGGWDAMLKLVLISMILDWVTGLIKSIKHKTLSSRTGFNGIIRKSVMLMVVAFAVGLDEVLNIQGDTVNARFIVLMFYMGNESLSMLENIEAIGVPIPSKLRDILIQCRKKGETEK
ncbi:MAG: phage holin family protein [Cetobacterium sp.]|uniref:phage holin family protein n=1 Tax=Cetobacterium sp. TaxID=2071632 RepID=UPI003F372534